MGCQLCPHKCGADREKGEVGICGGGGRVKAARAALHFWEEPSISGDRGSGAVFFSGCPMNCAFCQNFSISRNGAGMEISVERLAEIFIELQQKNAANINLVTPTPYLDGIIEGVKIARENGLKIPIIYNTSGYERVEVLKRLEGIVNVYLPDLKYMNNADAARYSGVDDYCDYAFAALDEMYRQTGKVRFDENGYIQSGMIVRHLTLPTRIDIAKDITEYLLDRFGDNIYISLMNQYTPFGELERVAELKRTVSVSEYNELIEYAVAIGLENGYIQQFGTADESFVPEFNCEGIKKAD